MKSKNEIMAALARTADDRLLLAGLLDKAQTCQTRGYLTHTKFLDLNERALCTEAVRLSGAAGYAVFWGGYEEAERGIYLFYPDYLDEQAAVQAAPVALLRARKRKEDTLTHRDYLGALMGLQIDRSVVGDILVHEEGADILVLEDMADFILLHFAKAGRKQISLTKERFLRCAWPQPPKRRGRARLPRRGWTVWLRSSSVLAVSRRRKRSSTGWCLSTIRRALSLSGRWPRAIG